jgi:hypothetical protein
MNLLFSVFLLFFLELLTRQAKRFAGQRFIDELSVNGKKIWACIKDSKDRNAV